MHTDGGRPCRATPCLCSEKLQPGVPQAPLAWSHNVTVYNVTGVEGAARPPQLGVIHISPNLFRNLPWWRVKRNFSKSTLLTRCAGNSHQIYREPSLLDFSDEAPANKFFPSSSRKESRRRRPRRPRRRSYSARSSNQSVRGVCRRAHGARVRGDVHEEILEKSALILEEISKK